MTLDDIQKRVARIRKAKGDDETAHSMEDDLRADFIRHVAMFGDKDLISMAEAVLETENIDFARWCA